MRGSNRSTLTNASQSASAEPLRAETPWTLRPGARPEVKLVSSQGPTAEFRSTQVKATLYVGLDGRHRAWTSTDGTAWSGSDGRFETEGAFAIYSSARDTRVWSHHLNGGLERSTNRGQSFTPIAFPSSRRARRSTPSMTGARTDSSSPEIRSCSCTQRRPFETGFSKRCHPNPVSRFEGPSVSGHATSARQRTLHDCHERSSMPQAGTPHTPSH